MQHDLPSTSLPLSVMNRCQKKAMQAARSSLSGKNLIHLLSQAVCNAPEMRWCSELDGLETCSIGILAGIIL